MFFNCENIKTLADICDINGNREEAALTTSDAGAAAEAGSKRLARVTLSVLSEYIQPCPAGNQMTGSTQARPLSPADWKRLRIIGKPDV